MTYAQRHDQSRASEVNQQSNGVTAPPVPFLTAALDHLDDAGLCTCLTAPLFPQRIPAGGGSG